MGKLVDALNMIIVCYNKRMYADEITPEKAARIRSEAAAQLPGLVREIDRLRAEFEALNAGDEFFNDRMRKRFEITGNLIRFIRRELAGPSTDAAMFARLGIRPMPVSQTRAEADAERMPRGCAKLQAAE